MKFTTDVRLKHIAQEGNRLRMTLANVLTGDQMTKAVDHVVVENGSRPFANVYEGCYPCRTIRALSITQQLALAKQPYQSQTKIAASRLQE